MVSTAVPSAVRSAPAAPDGLHVNRSAVAVVGSGKMELTCVRELAVSFGNEDEEINGGQDEEELSVEDKDERKEGCMNETEPEDWL